jgi:hypothetical protein
MVSAQLVAPVLREQSKFCAPTLFELSNCLAARHLASWIDLTWMCQRTGLENDE